MLLDSAQNLAHTLYKALQSNLRSVSLHADHLHFNLIAGDEGHNILLLEGALPLVVTIHILGG